MKWLPETRERAQQEITLRMILSVSLLAFQGFTAAEMEKIHALGKELLRLQGPSPQLFNMLALLVLFYKFSGQMKSAQAIAEQLLPIAETLRQSGAGSSRPHHGLCPGGTGQMRRGT